MSGVRYRDLTIGAGARLLTDEELVHLLVAAGASRLTAERIVSIERGRDEAGRARRRGWTR
jgi:hypothetical protein